jgi:Domain of unknown function (DUF4274)
MLYPPGFAQEAIDREQFAIDAMIAWLSDKSPDVWMWFTQTANWDTCTPILSWMIEQRSCDRAVAATIFWMCDPVDLAEKVANPEDGRSLWYADELAQLILLTWKDRPPSDSGQRPLTYGNDTKYLAIIDVRPNRDDPLSVPQWLFGPFGERSFDQEIEQTPYRDENFREVMFALGHWFGDASPIPTTTKERLALETPQEARDRKLFGFILMVPALLMIGWYCIF